MSTVSENTLGAMLLQSLDPRRAILCGRANAERVAIRMTANSGQSHAVVRTNSKLQPFCVLPTDEGLRGAIELQVVEL